MKKKLILFLIFSVGIVILAALPRSIEVINGNYIFGYDQGKHWLAAKSIIIDHKFPLIGDEVGGGGGFFQGPGWFYLLAIPFFLFHGDPYGAIVLLWLLGVATAVLFLILFSSRLGRKEVLAAGTFIAIAPILISNSRLVWPPFVIPFLTTFYLWFIFRVLEGEKRYIFLIFFTIGAMAHFEIATAGTLAIATFIFTIFWVIKNKLPIVFLGLGLIGFMIPLSPLILFDLRHDFLNIRGMITTISGTKHYVGTWKEYIMIVSNHWMIFSDEFFRAFQVTYIPKIYLPSFLIAGSFAIFFDKKYPRIKKQFVGFLVSLPILLFFVFLGYKASLWAWWISELTIVYTVLAGIVFVYAWQKGFVMRIIVLTFITLMVASYMSHTYNSFSKELSDYGGVHKINGKKDALDVIYKDAQGEKFGLLIFSPPVYTYPYNYLLWWYGQGKYAYSPPYEKRDVFYLLIEPDPEEPWRHNGWLETVIKDGQVEKTWNLPSGFIIEKRKAYSYP